MKENPIPNKYFIDCDNTIFDTKFNPETGHYDFGQVLPGMKEAINRCAQGAEIVIFTSRPFAEWDDMRSELDRNGIVYNGIQSKPLGIAYVDDKNLTPKQFIDHFKAPRKAPFLYQEPPDHGEIDSDIDNDI